MAHFCHADWREDHTASWTVIHLHEILKIVGDLKGQGQVDLAQTVAGQHIDRLGSADLRFDHLVLTARLGNADRVMDLM